MPNFSTGQKRIFIAIVFGAFALRLISFFVWPRPDGVVHVDSHEYVPLAKSISEHGVFSLDFSENLTPNITRTPFYPAFLALTGGVDFDSLETAIFIQHFISTATVACGGLAAAVWFSPQVGLLTAAFLAVDSASIYYSRAALTETWAAFLLAGAWLALAIFFRRRSMFALFIAAIFTASGILNRPITIAIPWLWAPFIAFFIAKNEGRKTAAKGSAVWLAPSLAATGGWILRNALVAGFIGFSALGAVQWLNYKALPAQARAEGEPYGILKARTTARLAEQAAKSDNPQNELDRLYKQEARRLIAKYPLETVMNSLAGLAVIIFDTELGPAALTAKALGLTPGKGVAAIGDYLLTGWHLATVLLAVVGFIVLIKSGDWHGAAWLFITIGYYLAAPAGLESDLRFRVPIAAFALCLSAIGVSAIIEKIVTDLKSNPISE